MVCYRIADARHPIYHGAGAMLHGGRWNSIGVPVIYAAETFAGSLLEVLVHSNLSRVPRNHRVIQIEVPDDVAIESISSTAVPGWDSDDMIASRAFGDRWIQERRSAVLVVPGLVTGGRERNIVINPLHEQFPLLRASAPEPVDWDVRLFAHRPVQ